MTEKIIVKERTGKYEELLNNCIEPETFIIDWEKNSNYELSFTAFDDHSLAFNLLTNENHIIADGQEFVIKTSEPTLSGSTHTIDVKATHIGYECTYVRTNESMDGSFGFTPKGLFDYVTKNGQKAGGFTYEIHGDFQPVQFDNMGKCSLKDVLSKITDSWKGSVYTFDNRHIDIWSESEFKKDNGRVIHYYHDTSDVKLSADTTELQNIAMVYPSQKEATKTDTSDNSSDDSTTKSDDTKKNDSDTTKSKPEYIFPPFEVRDEDSIARFGEKAGEDINDDKSQNADDAKKSALSQMKSEPAITLTSTYYGDDDFFKGESVLLKVQPLNLDTNVTVVGIKKALLNFEQVKQITFNNTVQTYFDLENSTKNTITNLIDSKISNITNNSNGNNQSNKLWEVGEVK